MNTTVTTSNPDSISTLYDEDVVLADRIIKNVEPFQGKELPVFLYKKYKYTVKNYNEKYDTYINGTVIGKHYKKPNLLKNFNKSTLLAVYEGDLKARYPTFIPFVKGK